MKQIINTISASFIREATASPRMLEDLAAMEKYMSESYDGRTFVELIQNADDAQSSAVCVQTVGDALIVANNGRPFNEADIMAICRSGSSDKKRGNSIGYRGVGFKSATTISSEIIIYSGGAYFTFSKDQCARTLGKSPEKVPTIRIPFPYEASMLPTAVYKEIKKIEVLGFTTFFIFLKANIEKFISELEGFDSGWLLFLRNINSVDINLGSIKSSCRVSRDAINSTDTIVKISGSDDQWYIVTSDDVSLAFKYNAGEIVPCSSSESRFHCFLPTLDSVGFPFKVNADFSTDPSRKHLIMDEITHRAIAGISHLYSDTVVRGFSSTEVRLQSLITLLSTPLALSELSSELEKGTIKQLSAASWVVHNDGSVATPRNTTLLPGWLTEDETGSLIKNVPSVAETTPRLELLRSVNNLDKMLAKTGAKELGISQIAVLLQKPELIANLDFALLGKLFVYSCRSNLSNKDYLDKLYVPTIDGKMIGINTLTESIQLSTEFLESFSILTTKEKNTLVDCCPAFAPILKPILAQSKNAVNLLKRPVDSSEKSNLAISKWKTPAQNCITLETLDGNIAKDVSKKCEDYSVISTDETGDSYYIATKTVGELGESFALTEAEYAAAMQYGEKYKIYIFTTATSSIKYDVIINPAKSLHLNKVVKAWEWRWNPGNETTIDADGAEYVHAGNDVMHTDYDQMTGQQFELFCARLLIKNGYEDVELTKTSGDQGVDIIAFRDGVKYGIQCKCYSSNIGNGAVQEAFAGKTFYNCHVGVVLTNQYFSSSAIQLAENNGVVLWDRNMLMKLDKAMKVSE